jgi:hypothetical protein
MTLTASQRTSLLLTLALVMIGTRVNHFAAVPDASWAVFFLGGFYLHGIARWTFPLLAGLAVAIDYYVISRSGVSFWNHYCVSLGYWFLVPAYLSLWLGGAWLRRHYRGLSLHSLGALLVGFGAAVSLCFVISNGSFYWLSDSVAHRSFAGWIKNLGDWYLPYLYTASLYVAGAAVLHALAIQIARHLPKRTQAEVRTQN